MGVGSNAVITPVNMELTPCRVVFNGVDLGGSEGNVKVTGSFKKAPIKVDQTGEIVIDQKVSGFELFVETILSEVKNKDTWKAVYPNAKKISAGNGAIYFQEATGQSDLSLAAILLLHPLSISDSNLDYDHKFYKAVAESVSEITFGPSKQQGLKVKWRILPDTSVLPWRFWFHGDPANGIVAATAGSPVYTGTGNGAISNVVAKNNGTRTETITLTCVGVPGSNQSNWNVTGAGGREIGFFSITSGSANFSAPEIGLTLADGTTDFVIGDNFTIAMVAANYA